MIKRMVIMLVAVAIVFGGIFGFQVFKAAMIKKFIGALSNPPQTISASKASASEWSPKIEAIGSLRAVKGADLSLEVSGVVESISFNSGDDVEEGATAVEAAHRRRCRAIEFAAGDGGIERDHIRARSEAIQDAGGQPGDDRYRRRQPEERQGAGGAAAGHHRQEDLAGAVLRPSRHPRRRSRAISRRRHSDRDAAGARSDLSSTFMCRSSRSIRCSSARRSREGRCVQGADLHRQDIRDQSEGRRHQSQRADPRHA